MRLQSSGGRNHGVAEAAWQKFQRASRKILLQPGAQTQNRLVTAATQSKCILTKKLYSTRQCMERRLKSNIGPSRSCAQTAMESI